MIKLVEQQRQKMTPEQLEKDRKALNSEDNKKLGKLMRKRAGLQSAEATQYALGIVYSSLHVPSKWGLTMIALQTLQGSLPYTAIAVTPLLAGLSAVVNPLAIMGTVTTILKGLNIAFGPTLGRLYFPLIMMINQRLLLAAEDQAVEKFY